MSPWHPRSMIFFITLVVSMSPLLSVLLYFRPPLREVFMFSLPPLLHHRLSNQRLPLTWLGPPLSSLHISLPWLILLLPLQMVRLIRSKVMVLLLPHLPSPSPKFYTFSISLLTYCLLVLLFVPSSVLLHFSLFIASSRIYIPDKIGLSCENRRGV